MSKTLTCVAKASVNWDHQNVDATVGNTVNTNNYSYSKNYANGTAASQVDLIHVTSGTITASGTATFDVAGGLTDFFGATITMARVKVLYVELTTDTTSSSINVGAGSNPLLNWVIATGDGVKVRNGGCFFLSAPDATAYAVTAGTGDVLTLTNNDGSNAATYKLAIAGCSA